jgi:hypothetical protein
VSLSIPRTDFTKESNKIVNIEESALLDVEGEEVPSSSPAVKILYRLYTKLKISSFLELMYGRIELNNVTNNMQSLEGALNTSDEVLIRAILS